MQKQQVSSSEVGSILEAGCIDVENEWNVAGYCALPSRLVRS